MKNLRNMLARRYQAALREYLKNSSTDSLQAAQEFGCRASASGLETLDVAKIHEAALASLEVSSNRDQIHKRAESFFSEAVTPIEKTHRAALKATTRLNQLNKTLSRCTVDLATSSRLLKQGIAQRKAVEQALKKSAAHYARVVGESRHLQKQLQDLTHQMLTAQEAQRQKISRKLHDEVAQTLLGINVRLVMLKQEATASTLGLKKEIASTQRLVKSSVKTMSRFASEFGKQYDR
jgi:signal transduction histidine kinase